MSNGAGILVIGASRGLGTALAHIAAERHPQHIIFASARKPAASTELSKLHEKVKDRLVLLAIDLNKESTIIDAVKIVREHVGSLKAIWINAVDYGDPVPINEMTAPHLLDVLRTNVAGVHLCFQHFSPLVVANKEEKRGIYTLSSSVGSISFAAKANPIMKQRFGVSYVPGPQYGISKAALNMLTRSWADPLEQEGILVAALHPGATKSTGSSSWFDQLADYSKGMSDAIEPHESAAGMWDAVEAATPEQTAEGMLTRGGKVIPW